MFFSSRLYDKRDDFDFDIVNFPFLDEDIPRAPSYGVYITQLILFAKVSSPVADFNTRNKMRNFSNKDISITNSVNLFSRFYRRHYDWVSNFNVGPKSLLKPEFYGDLVYKFSKNDGRKGWSDQFKEAIIRYKRIGYNMNVKRQNLTQAKHVTTIRI